MGLHQGCSKTHLTFCVCVRKVSKWGGPLGQSIALGISDQGRLIEVGAISPCRMGLNRNRATGGKEERAL